VGTVSSGSLLAVAEARFRSDRVDWSCAASTSVTLAACRDRSRAAFQGVAAVRTAVEASVVERTAVEGSAIESMFGAAGFTHGDFLVTGETAVARFSQLSRAVFGSTIDAIASMIDRSEANL
jgi:hypothetical protein